MLSLIWREVKRVAYLQVMTLHEGKEQRSEKELILNERVWSSKKRDLFSRSAKKSRILTKQVNSDTLRATNCERQKQRYRKKIQTEWTRIRPASEITEMKLAY